MKAASSTNSNKVSSSAECSSAGFLCFLVFPRKRRKIKTFIVSKAVLVSVSYIVLKH